MRFRYAENIFTQPFLESITIVCRQIPALLSKVLSCLPRWKNYWRGISAIFRKESARDLQGKLFWRRKNTWFYNVMGLISQWRLFPPRAHGYYPRSLGEGI